MGHNGKDVRFPWNLFFSLMLLNLLPFLFTIVRTKLIVSLPSVDGLGIAGHMEWFDLINETIQAFLIVPLYALLRPYKTGTREFKERAFQAFFLSTVVYLFFAVVVFVYCNQIVTAMVPGPVHEITRYLQLETMGFILANTVSFIHVLFIILEKPWYFYAMTILKTLLTVVGDLVLIPAFGINGIAYSNIAVNALSILLCLSVVRREKLVAVSFRFDKPFVRRYLFIGLFSGSQILLDNLIYSGVVCKMVNAVAEQGNYWTANNIIWGLMLLPMTALADIIKKDCGREGLLVKMRTYHRIILVTFLVWLCLIPLMDPFLKNLMGIENPGTIKHIILALIPYYLAYNYTVLFDNLLIGHGKTSDLFVISMVVNLLYYPIVYRLVVNGTLTPNIHFICVMFGVGMVVHLCGSMLFFVLRRKSLFQA